jgi:site-specific DNA recombinase
MRAVIYAAKSTKDEKESIPTQLEEGRQKANLEGRDVAAEFTDEAASAWSGDRGPGLEAALHKSHEIVAEDGACELWVWKSERLARGSGKKNEARSLLEVYTQCKRAGVVLRSVLDDAYVQDEAMIGMASKMANKYSEDLSQLIKAGKRRSRERGTPHGGKRRFGFEPNRDGAMTPIPAEIAVVDRILDELLAGRSYCAIARSLAADGVATATGGHWQQRTIAQIAQNPVYIGKLRTRDGVAEAPHGALVDLAKWEQAQILMEAKAARSKGRGRPSSGQHLFRKGMLRCGECGESMVPRTSRQKGKSTYEVYGCYGRHLDPANCSMPVVKRTLIDLAVYRYFEQVGLDVEATRDALTDSRDRKLTEVHALHEQAVREKRRAEDRLARVRRDYMDDQLTAADWADLRAELEPERDAAAAEVDRLDAQGSEVENWGEVRDMEAEVLTRLADIRRAIGGDIESPESVDAARAALSRLFEHFVIRPVQPGTRVHARLAWVGDFVLEPVAREQAVEGYSDLRPLFRREPLYDAQDNQMMTWTVPPSTDQAAPAT